MNSKVLVSLSLVHPILSSGVPLMSQVMVAYRWQYDIDQHVVSMSDAAGSVLATECSSRLANERSSANPISFQIDPAQAWNGTISVGAGNYPFLWDETTSGPNCDLAYGDAFVVVECSFAYALPASLISAPAVADCFAADSTPSITVQLSGWTNQLHASHSNNTTEALHVGRQTIPQLLVTRDTQLVGNGDPTQELWHRQETESLDCQISKCRTDVVWGQVVNIGFMAAIEVWKWVSFGFDVGASRVTNELKTCGGDYGQVICLWQKVAVTGINVRNVISICSVTGCKTKEGEMFRLSSPNIHQLGPGYCCVVNTGRSNGDAYWLPTGKGGPPTK